MELRRKLPYEDIPWYPEYDEEGGNETDIPFVEAGILTKLVVKQQQKTGKEKRGSKPSSTGAAREGSGATKDSQLPADGRQESTPPPS